MKTLEDIRKKLIDCKKELEQQFKVKKISIFGSYVRGEQKKISDIDILVDFNEPVSLLEFIKLENYLSDLLGVKVDLIPKKGIRPELKKQILSEAVRI